jgi:UDP-2,3-diacylglucosamine hydrolase
LAAGYWSEIDLPDGSLAIGDCHLDVEGQGADPAPFLAFLRAIQGVPVLLLLGDLFETWLGRHSLARPRAREVCAELARLSRFGTRLELLHGNRDFLLGSDFARATGAQVRPRGVVGKGPQRRVLFLHGDELCTLDLGYQRLKRVLRSAAVGAFARSLPAAPARGLGRMLRGRARASLEHKPAAKIEQQAQEAWTLLQRSDCQLLVCGHAHRFREERGPLGARWLVLDAFGGARDLWRAGAEPGMGSSAALCSSGQGLSRAP